VETSGDHPSHQQRRKRFWVLCPLLIGPGLLMIAAYSLAPDTKVSEAPSLAWQTISSTDDLLALSMPGKPQIHTQESDSELGRARQTKHSLSINADTIIFSINEIHYLDEDLQFDPKECVTLMAQSTVSKSQGMLIREREVRLGMHTGKEIGVRFSNGYAAWMRFFFVGRCAYQVKIVIPQADLESPIVSRYFDSISIKPAETPVK
jgi:hypothetical protein